MPDYKEGKVYMIWSPHTDKVYIGSTTQPLHKRFHDHCRTLNGGKYTTAIEVLACGDAKIELIEAYPCASKAELHRREGQIIRERGCVNKNVAGRTPSEYYQDNREAIAAYYQIPEVKAHTAARMKEYREQPDIKARIAARRKEYSQRPDIKAHTAARVKEHRKRPEVKALYNARMKEYRQRPEVKAQHSARMKEYRQQNREQIAAKKKEYQQRPDVKARKNELARERYHRKKQEQHP